MSESGSRPGGLTALAVINFVWSGFACLVVMGLGLALAVFETARRAAEADNQEFGAFWVIGVLLVLYALSAALLITSGIGYIKQKNFLGRIMGSVWAVLSLCTLALEVSQSNQGFQLMSLVWVIYPGLTLILLNTTFKEDFVNP